MRGIEGKVVVLGSRGVGKTWLVTKYINDTQHKDMGPTIAASFFTCKLIVQDVKVKLQIWDTAGQERYKAVAPMYYRNANAAILVFDLSQYNTFKDVKSWVQELHRNVQESVILVLVGNKLDLNAESVVSHDEAMIYAASIGASYIETCAKTNQGLEQVFVLIALGLINLAQEGRSRSLRQFDSCDSISTYANSTTAFSHSASSRLSAIPTGIHVEENDEVKSTGVGRLETQSWSIEHIALGEEVHTSWCCI